MDPFIAEVTTLVGKPPPASARAAWDACALVPWSTRVAQGMAPLRVALQRHAVMLDQQAVIPTNAYLCDDIAATYALHAAQVGAIYVRPQTLTGRDAEAMVRALVQAVHAERQPPTLRLPMTLLADGRVAIEFTDPGPPRAR